jgi:NAD(P)-dependent dehydrogenase (short-subunit alcohol dehydrogenase family)
MAPRDRRDAPAPDLRERTVLVTGANSGIGKETAVALAAMGARVTITARNPERGRAALDEVRHRSANPDVELASLDLASLASVRAFAEEFLATHPELHVLVNNAGLITGTRRVTADGFEEMFGVNHLGHFLLTDLLVERLVASAPARVVVLTSVAHRVAPRGLRFDDLQSERRFRSFAVYGRSKLANAMHAAELARRLQGTGVTVNCVHPGSISSGFGGDGDTRLLGELVASIGRVVMGTPERGARTPVLLASSEDPRFADATGGYFSHGRRWRPSRAARDEAAARRLWDESARLVADAGRP